MRVGQDCLTVILSNLCRQLDHSAQICLVGNSRKVSSLKRLRFFLGIAIERSAFFDCL